MELPADSPVWMETSLLRVPSGRAAGPEAPDDAARTEAEAEGGLDGIIGRRDVATVPWATIALCSLGVAVSSALRPPVDHVPDGLLIPLAAIYGLLAFAMVLLQDTPFMRWLARQLE